MLPSSPCERQENGRIPVRPVGFGRESARHEARCRRGSIIGGSEVLREPLERARQAALRSHNWPENVRELANTMRRAVALCDNGEVSAHLLRVPVMSSSFSAAGYLKPGLSFRDLEKSLLQITLEATSGNRTHAAELLGVSLRTICNKIREYGLPPRSFA